MRLAALALLFIACGEPEATDDEVTADSDSAAVDPCEGVTPAVTNITPAELVTMLETKDFELINVHIPDAGQIPGTDVHIAYTDTAGLEAHLDDLGTKAVLYCRTGPMSEIAAEALIDLGYCQIYDMPAGMVGWESAGNTIEATPSR
jgi:rhodanese-related sulfurtransferase